MRICPLFKERLVVFRVERDRPGRRLVPLEFSRGTPGGLREIRLWAVKITFSGCLQNHGDNPTKVFGGGIHFIWTLLLIWSILYKHLEQLFDDAGDITSGKCCECRLFIVWSMPHQLHLNHHALHKWSKQPPANKRKDRVFFRNPRDILKIYPPWNLHLNMYPAIFQFMKFMTILHHFHGRNKIWSSWIPFALQKLGFAVIFWGLGFRRWKAKPSTAKCR